MPECIVIFPDGVRVVPPLLPGTVEIAEASSLELEKSRIISWAHHGIFISEESPDKIFAVMETVEKAAGIHRRVLGAGGPKQVISEEILRQLSAKFAEHHGGATGPFGRLGPNRFDPRALCVLVDPKHVLYLFVIAVFLAKRWNPAFRKKHRSRLLSLNRKCRICTKASVTD